MHLTQLGSITWIAPIYKFKTSTVQLGFRFEALLTPGFLFNFKHVRVDFKNLLDKYSKQLSRRFTSTGKLCDRLCDRETLFPAPCCEWLSTGYFSLRFSETVEKSYDGFRMNTQKLVQRANPFWDFCCTPFFRSKEPSTTTVVHIQ